MSAKLILSIENRYKWYSDPLRLRSHKTFTTMIIQLRKCKTSVISLHVTSVKELIITEISSICVSHKKIHRLLKLA